MVTHQLYHKTMEWHYEVTMKHSMMSSDIMVSHMLHYRNVLMKPVLPFDVFQHCHLKIKCTQK